MTQVITIEPAGGLCNRMLAINSALALAKVLDCDLVMNWRISQGLTCRFERLFEALPGLSKIHTVKGWEKPFPAQKPDCLRIETDDAKRFFEPGFLDVVRSHETVHIRCCYNFFLNPEGYDAFQPLPNLLRRIEEFDTSGLVGVHIRRTDHQKAINKSPLGAFVALMRRELEKNGETRFFLATDCPHTEGRLHQLFPDRVLSRDSVNRSRSSPAGIEDAVVDLYCLAGCAEIFGSYWSSFSSVASEIGGVALTVASPSMLQASRRLPSAESPRISVVLTTHNRLTCLKRAIRSVLEQDFPDFELVIVNDASDDGTKEYLAEIRDPKVRLINHDENLGAASAYNSGIKAARGRYVSILNDDDFHLPGFLAKMSEHLEATQAVLSWVAVRDGFEGQADSYRERRARCRRYASDLAKTDLVSIGSCRGFTIERSKFEEVGLFDTSLRHEEDTDFFLRFTQHETFVSWSPLDEVLVQVNRQAQRLTLPTESRIEARESILNKHKAYLAENPMLDILIRRTHANLYFRAGQVGRAAELALRLKEDYYEELESWVPFRKFDRQSEKQLSN